MFQGFGACNLTLFGDMTDNENRYVIGFTQLDDLGSGITHSSYGTGDGRTPTGSDGLDGIDD